MQTFIAALIAGLISGIALGLTGGGGSVLGVPLLVYMVGLEMHLAIGTSLIAVGISALVSSLHHMRRGHVLFRVAILMSITGIPGVYVGSYLNRMVSGEVLLILFALLMIFIGINMLRTAKSKHEGEHRTEVWLILTLGAIVGILSGFLGIGGGFLIVPALLWGANLKMHDAVGTSLLIIFINGMAGMLSYELQGRPVDYSITLLFVIGGLLGGVLGARVGTSLSTKNLKYAFSIVVFLLAAYIIATNLATMV
ncbi:MAG: sulfite exporter TauE/SafE family protein [Euryarchaeota archaeon]|nr:sulfite exporter TauE/SafE family protein [Euryarchaeota archaeon]